MIYFCQLSHVLLRIKKFPFQRGLNLDKRFQNPVFSWLKKSTKTDYLELRKSAINLTPSNEPKIEDLLFYFFINNGKSHISSNFWHHRNVRRVLPKDPLLAAFCNITI